MASDTLVIVNPVAGGGQARRARPILDSYLREHGVRADFSESRSTEDFRAQAARAVDAGRRTIAALGGDGSFHHLVEAACGRDVTLGFFPAGNGNDIASGLGLSCDPIAAAREFLRASPRPIDVLRAEFSGGARDILIGAGGTGLDAEAARLANTRLRAWPGVARYVAGALLSLASFRPIAIEAELDTDAGPSHWRGRVLLAVVANAPRFGAGFRIAPAAIMDDGWMDILFLETLPWTRIVEAIPILLRSGDLRWPELHRFRARRVRIEADRRAAVQGDGELLGETPVEFRVEPVAVRVIAPARGGQDYLTG